MPGEKPQALGLPNEEYIPAHAPDGFVYVGEPAPGLGASVYTSIGYLIIRVFQLNGRSSGDAYEYQRDRRDFGECLTERAHSPLEASCILFHLVDRIRQPTHVTTGGNNHDADPGV
jgi:hypothetical protein